MPGMAARGGGMGKSASTPSLGGGSLKARAKAGAGAGPSTRPRAGRLNWAEAEIAKAQKALLATSEQMRQDAHGFMLASVAASVKDKTKNPEVEAAEAFYQAKKKKHDTIPEDFFLQLAEEVEQHIDGTTPRSSPALSRAAVEGARFKQSPGRTLTIASGQSTPRSKEGVPASSQSVEFADFLAKSPDLDSTVRPQSPRRAVSEFGSATSEAGAGQPRWASNVGDLNRGHPQVDRMLLHGSKFMTALGEVTPTASVPREPGVTLLSSSMDVLLEDLKGAAEASRIETESLAPPATVLDEDEVPFWERVILTAEDDEKREIDQAIWRFRKYLRNRFGSAQEAWNALEGARKTVGGAEEMDEGVRQEGTLSIAEVKIALSRLGIKLPFITGFNKVKVLLNAIDKNNTRVLTYTELMGDEETDRSLLADPPPKEKETWQTDLRQPRWLTPWETGFFDKEMLESLVTRDYFLPTQVGKQKLTTSKIAPKDYKPVWQKYQQVMDERRCNREEMIRDKREKELEGCTFKPDMEYSKRTAKRILWAKKLRRACSQPIKSIHQANLEKMIDATNRQDSECTFHPTVCSRSNLIFSNMLDTGQPWWQRLAKEGHHDRMHHISHMVNEQEAALTFQPDDHDTDDFQSHLQHRNRCDTNVSVFDRLLHHDKHEYWHGDQRGISPGEEAHLSSMPQWAEATFSPDQLPLQSGRQRATKVTPRAGAVPDTGEAGDLTVEYRQTMLGLMEACERYGTNDDPIQGWSTAKTQPPAKSTSSSARRNTREAKDALAASLAASRSSPALQQNTTSATSGHQARSATKAKSTARSLTPPSRSNRAPTSRSR